MTTSPSSRPRLLVVAGPNGAGKTTITERGLAHEWFHDCEYVNPDNIAQNELGDGTMLPRCSEQRSWRRNDVMPACARGGAWLSRPCSRQRTNRNSCAKR